MTVVEAKATVAAVASSSDTSLTTSSDELLHKREEDKNHIYEEIPAKQSRPLPPIPKDSVVSTTSTVVSVSSKLSRYGQ